MIQCVADMERARHVRRGNHDAIWLAGMGRRGVEIARLVPDLGPTCFDRLGVVGFVELGCAHLVDLVYLVDLVCLVAGFFSIVHESRGILACEW